MYTHKNAGAKRPRRGRVRTVPLQTQKDIVYRCHKIIHESKDVDVHLAKRIARTVELEELPLSTSKFRKWHRIRRDPTTNKVIKANRGIAIWSIPPNLKAKARILFLHGGLHKYTSPSDPSILYTTTTVALQTGYPVLAIDYRLCPEHKFPAALEDAEEALEYIWRYGPKGLYSPCEEVYIFGDGAGGGVSLALCIKLRDNPASQTLMPQRLCMISPWLDLNPNPKSYEAQFIYRESMFGNGNENSGDPFTYGDAPSVLKYAKDSALSYAKAEEFSNPLVSPLQDPQMHHGLPPALIIVGQREWAFHHMALKLAETYTNSETLIFEQMWHCFHQYLDACGQCELREAHKAHRCISTFFESKNPLPLASVEYIPNEPLVCFGLCSIS